MNSSKRGAAYGFRLQSLDAVRRGSWPGGWGLGLVGGPWLITYPCPVVGDEVDRPKTDIIALLGEGHC